jgi:hypothetical protein
MYFSFGLILILSRNTSASGGGGLIDSDGDTSDEEDYGVNLD